MKDVAELAQVSVQTVSNYVNGRRNLMGAETQERVAWATEKLGYYPNVSARSLRSASTRTLGMLLIDPHLGALADPLTSLLIAGAGEVVREKQFGLFIQASRTVAKDPDFLVPVREGRVDGVLTLIAGELDMRLWYLEELDKLGIPYVVFDQPMGDFKGCAVRASERQSARALTEHLLAKGHRRIGFIAARVPWAVVEERHAGFREALGAAGLEPQPELELFEGGWEPVGGGEMARKLLSSSNRPTAIMGASDLLAVGAIKEVREMGLSVPDDIAVTGFDDFMFAEYTDPPLTTVKVPAFEMGRQAAGLLIESLESGRPVAGERVLPTTLCLRASA